MYIDIEILLNSIAKALDITEVQYNEVVLRYNSVSAHLANEKSLLSEFNPTIKPQGSFLIGTMIRPIIEDDELDVDLVCRLYGKKVGWTQYDVKKAIKDQLIKNADYKRMLDEEGNRCWTLTYHDTSRFHMDILPAIVSKDSLLLMEKTYNNLSQNQIEELAIHITDKRRLDYYTEKNTNKWSKSNPFGYAIWFKERAKLKHTKAIVLEANVEPLPAYQGDKNPLLKVVQILKRHRDIMFGANETKPISIIITTLAANAYKKETGIIDALVNILDIFLNPNFIYRKYSVEHNKEIWWVTNPVNLEENFADKWPLNPELEDSFFSWYEKVKFDISKLKDITFTKAYNNFKDLLGTRSVNEAVDRSGLDRFINEKYQPINFSSKLLNVEHREHPRWRQELKYNVEIYGHYKDPNGKRITISNNTILPKLCDIYFVASTNVPRPFEVYWQIVNTGEEAKRYGGLRGGIYIAKTAGKGGLNQRECSQYKGLHWAECFIVKNEVCVARSTEFQVNIE